MTDARFQPTRWSLVSSARGEDEVRSRAALEELCGAYWYPLYVFLRRTGSDPQEASDLTQDFFAALVERDYVGDADRERGRFRTFLLAALKNHTSKQRAKARARKRGGGATMLSLDFEAGEERYAREPEDERTAEAIFERRWALLVLDRALKRLAGWFRAGGPEKAERYEALRPLLGGEGTQSYRDVGLELGMSETAVKVAVHRMRQRYRDIVRAEIADTVGDPGLVEDELARLRDAVRS